ncbi:hypothetical protein EYF80_033861 [Liparis tanakae]|uniref:Uncharacterized protein n=1 Tax=Liparis tanakae TaxID=230148 RepID=A0A4Z2GS28_9TELE|nr:hypothetical protein EYF80_033861 [Liparis tanakae]
MATALALAAPPPAFASHQSSDSQLGTFPVPQVPPAPCRSHARPSQDAAAAGTCYLRGHSVAFNGSVECHLHTRGLMSAALLFDPKRPYRDVAVPSGDAALDL